MNLIKKIEKIGIFNNIFLNWCILSRLLEASLDAAVLTPTHSPSLATGVEICQCPQEYNGTSCQDPSVGFYRWYKNTTATSTIVIDLVGQAKRCQCNNRSEVCDRETGYCLVSITQTFSYKCTLHADNNATGSVLGDKCARWVEVQTR